MLAYKIGVEIALHAWRNTTDPQPYVGIRVIGSFSKELHDLIAACWNPDGRGTRTSTKKETVFLLIVSLYLSVVLATA
jgi:hypothetical protein